MEISIEWKLYKHWMEKIGGKWESNLVFRFDTNGHASLYSFYKTSGNLLKVVVEFPYFLSTYNDRKIVARKVLFLLQELILSSAAVVEKWMWMFLLTNCFFLIHRHLKTVHLAPTVYQWLSHGRALSTFSLATFLLCR